jgi:hypothetical protein
MCQIHPQGDGDYSQMRRTEGLDLDVFQCVARPLLRPVLTDVFLCEGDRIGGGAILAVSLPEECQSISTFIASPRGMVAMRRSMR